MLRTTCKRVKQLISPASCRLDWRDTNIPLVCIQTCPPAPQSDAVNMAAFMGQLDRLILLAEKSHSFSHETLSEAISGGSTEVVRWLLSTGKVTVTPEHHHHIMDAVSGGYVSMVNVMLRHGAAIWNEDNPSTFWRVCFAACGSGSIDMVDFIASLCGEEAEDYMLSSDGFTEACCAGNIRLLKHLLKCGSDMPCSNAILAAAEHGHIHVVKWLRDEMRVEFAPFTFCAAVRGGSMDMLEFLHSINCPFSREGFEFGHIDNLDLTKPEKDRIRTWLEEKGCPPFVDEWQ